jgi:hypothetical protein
MGEGIELEKTLGMWGVLLDGEVHPINVRGVVCE